MSTARNTDRKSTFDEAAELYDRARPGYPAELFDEIARLAGLRSGATVLEIGSGTGQATVPLAERGYHITALEPGSNLAAIARRKLARYPGVTVNVTTFEDWALPREPFDAVIAATALHWVDPSVRLTKAAAALRPGGALAVIDTRHIPGGDVGFFMDVQACYKSHAPSLTLTIEPGREITDPRGELDAGRAFEPAIVQRYEWEQTYTAREYIELLGTYSDHRPLDEIERLNLLESIARLIDDRYGGQIRKRYLNELSIARRRHAGPRPGRG